MANAKMDRNMVWTHVKRRKPNPPRFADHKLGLVQLEKDEHIATLILSCRCYTRPMMTTP